MKDISPKTIKSVLESVGFLQETGPHRRFGNRQVPVSPKTITQIAEKTGINQQRLKQVIRDLNDSQLIDVALQQSGFRKPILKPEARYSEPRKPRRHPRTKVPKGLTPAEEFEYRVRKVSFVSLLNPRDIYLRFYRTELGEEWLEHYRKHPNSRKKLSEIRNRHRLSNLPKTPWDSIFKDVWSKPQQED